MRANEGYMDRAARMAGGIAMLALAFSGTVAGWTSVVLIVLGSVGLLTGTVGFCPLYRAFGWNTHHEQA